MRWLSLVGTCLLAACATTGHTLAYKKAVTARDSARALLAKADEPYGRHADEMLSLINELDQGYADARSQDSKKQWLLVKDDVQRFAADWQHLEALGGPYLAERTKIIIGDLDAIIETEEKKTAD